MIYIARRKKDDDGLASTMRCAGKKRPARDGSDSCSMRVFINTGRRAGFVKSARSCASRPRRGTHVTNE